MIPKGTVVWDQEKQQLTVYPLGCNGTDLSERQEVTLPGMWPSEWPQEVTPQRLRTLGYRLYLGTQESFEQELRYRINKQTVAELADEIYSQKVQLSATLKSMNTRVKRLRSEARELAVLIRERRVLLQEMPTHEKAVSLRERESIPLCSGVYAAWHGERCKYVGKANCLRSRLSASHHALTLDDLVTWLEVPVASLSFVEAFFIGTLRPSLNKAKPEIKRVI